MASTYWLYGRYSDPSQGRGDSEDRQHTALDRFLREHDIAAAQVVQIQIDRGRSAYHGHHITKGHFGRWLAGIADRDGDHLVVENVDRLSRLDYLDAHDLISSILKAGITLHVCGFPYELTRASLNKNPGAIYMLTGEIQRARQESSRKAEFSRRSWEQTLRAAQQGKNTRHKCPSWLKWDSAKEQYVLIHDRAETVRLIYELTTKHRMGAKLIEQYLIKHRVPKFAHRNWTWQYVQKILTTRATRGEMQFHRTTYDIDGKRILKPEGEPIADYFPAAVSEKLWLQAAAMREKRTISRQGGGIREAPNLFHGRIKCARCGESMYLRASFSLLVSGERLRHHYYNCSRKSLTCDMVRGWPVRQVEERILTYIANELDPAVLAGDEAAQSSLAGVLQSAEQERKKEKELKIQHNTVVNLLMDSNLPVGGRDVLYNRMQEIETELNAATARAESAEIEAAQLQESFAHVKTSPAVVRRLIKNLDHDDARTKIKVAIAAVVSQVRLDTEARWIEVVFGTGTSRRIWESRLQPIEPGVVRLLPDSQMQTLDRKNLKNTCSKPLGETPAAAHSEDKSLPLREEFPDLLRGQGAREPASVKRKRKKSDR